MKKLLGSRVTTLVLVALVSVFAIHVVAQHGETVRADVTADNLYSLSDGSREILERMRQEGVPPIEVELYFSETVGKTLPKFIKDFITYHDYVRALLEEYEVASGGKIEARFIDPLPDSDEAQDAVDFGLDGKPVNQHGDLFFFGLVFETQTGSRDRIEFLWPAQQESIEYEISKHIHGLIWPERQRVGVLSSLTVLSEATNPYMAQILAQQGKSPGKAWYAMQLLEEQYQVSKIDIDTDHISADEYDLVIVIHPKNLGQRALWALDEWVQRGGSTLVFLDPYALPDQAPQNPQQPWAALQYDASSDLGPLLAAWGIEREERRVAADFELGLRRAVSARGPAQQLIVDLAIDEQSLADTVDSSHPALQGLNDLRFFLAGSLRRVGGDDEDPGDEGSDGEGDLTLQALISTTGEGGTLHMEPGFPIDPKPGTPRERLDEEAPLVFQDVSNPGKVADRFIPGDGPAVLAYQLQGRLPSAFPGGADLPGATPPPPPGLPPGVDLPPPPPTDEVERKEPVPEEERQPATVIVFADVDFISDQVAFQTSPFGALAANDNHKLLLNSVDYLFGSESLMKVRSKKPIRRPFTLFDEIEARADAQTREREAQLRAEIDRVEAELQEKQRATSGKNAALFAKQLQDEVDDLNTRIADAERELREIRKQKRAALEDEEARVKFATMGLTPTFILLLGLALFFRRRLRDVQARRSAP